MLQDGNTALILSANRGKFEIVCHLVANGADVNAQDKVRCCLLVMAEGGCWGGLGDIDKGVGGRQGLV